MLCLEEWDGLSEGTALGGMRFAVPGRPVRLSAAVPPVQWSRVLHLRTHAGLAGEDRVRFRPPHVSPRTAQWLSRARRRMASGHLALDPGLSPRRPPFLAGRAPPDPHTHTQCGTTSEPRGRRRLRLAVALRRPGWRVGTLRCTG